MKLDIMQGPDLGQYDWIVINTSGGKDSQAMLWHVYQQAKSQGLEGRLVAVHADLGRVEWKGARSIAEEQAKALGVRFEAVSRPQGDLLEQVRQRGMWPSSSARYCTSDHKRGQVAKVLTKLGKERSNLGRPVRILNCMGLRAQESSARAKRQELEPNKVSTGKGKVKVVTNWHPILDWSEEKVWQTIRESGLPHHFAYDLGMPRLSCCFCIFAPKSALVVAGKHNPELLEEYVQVEKEIGHTFTVKTSMADIKQAVEAGEAVTQVESWAM